MERTKQNIPDLILCSDIHLREDTPVCRTDNYWERQWIKMDFIADLQKQYGCPVVCGGDLFHHWKASPYLLSETMLHIPKKFYSIAGQHDLANHSLSLFYKSSIHTLERAGKLVFLPRVHFGMSPEDFQDETSAGVEDWLGIEDKKILVWHKLAYQTEPFPGATGGNALQLLKKYPQFDLILCGDNHVTFVEEYQGRLLVNPGSMMRMTAIQADHKPCVFLWYAESNSVVQVFLPIEEGVVSREHLAAKEQRNDRIDAFVNKLTGDYKTELSFEENLNLFFQTNDVEEDVKQIIYKAIE